MKTVEYKVLRTGERVFCSDPKKDIEVIDGVEYLIVTRYASDRAFLMRKDALERIKEKMPR